MDALLSGVVIAALSGLTALAFRHTAAFARLYPYLTLLVSIVFLALSVWQLAVFLSWSELQSYLDTTQRDAAYAVKRKLQLPYPMVCAAYVAVLAFLWVNVKLPRFIKKAEQGRRQSEDCDSEI